MTDKKNYFNRGQIQEKLGYSLHRAAFQSENREEFHERVGKAVESYEVAYKLYENVADEKGAGWGLRCWAFVKYLEHWIEPDPSEKLRLLEEALETKKRALTAFQGTENMLEYSKTYNMLTELVWHRSYREYEKWRSGNEFDIDEIQQSRARIRQIVEEGIRWGETSIATLSKLSDSHETAKAHYALAQCLVFFSLNLASGIEEKEQYNSRAREKLHKVIDLSEIIKDEYTLGHAYYLLGLNNYGEDGKKYLESALEFSEKTRDIYLMARVLNNYIDNIWWLIVNPIEYPVQKIEQGEKIMAFYDRSMFYCSIMSFYGYGGDISGMIPTPGGYCEFYWIQAYWETDPQKRLELLDKSVEKGMEALKLAEEGGHKVGDMRHILSKALVDWARLEPNLDQKKLMLEKALIYREIRIALMEKWGATHFWNAGIQYIHISNIRAQLAYIAPDLDDKRKLLEKAVLDKEKGIKLMFKWIHANEKHMHYHVVLSQRLYEYSTLLTGLHDLTNESEYLRKAIEASQKAIESASKVDMFSRIAESHWKIAREEAILGEHMEAAESFRRSSESYEKAVEKIPQLKEFYQEYASYMRAWSEIEMAKHHHAEKRHGDAMKHYEKAAELHNATERWSYLAPNYEAWAMVERAEQLSRTEQTQEARDLFQQASKLFSEAKKSITNELKTIKTAEERLISENLIKASDNRYEYCHGRADLEDARILNRRGNYSASSKRYNMAVEKFQKVMNELEHESDRRELLPIIYLCQAWEKMMMAEARASPELYFKAAEYFELAWKHATDQSTSYLAQAHNSFCRALETGTRFERDRDSNLYSAAKNHIEAATSHYLRAGYQTMSDYAAATSRLLDAYLYTYNAQTEVDLEKKAQFYKIAEKLLQSSAGSYLKAKHPEKSDEVRRILGRVKEEREIAVSLSEVLHTPSLMSTTASFSSPTPSDEQAIGLERFESADIQANLIARSNEVCVGEDLNIEIELVNAGKAPAQLVKVEDIIFEGFEFKSVPETCRVEDNYLNMKGRTLSPLKTAELKLVLNPLTKGTYEFKPRIMYLNEAGKYMSHEPDPVSITVQEFGIKGWLKGPKRVR